MSGSLRLEGKLGKIAERSLIDVCRLLDKYDIPYVLEGGTLLGIIREQRLLPWDNDVDITILEKDYEKLIGLRVKFWFAGYKFRPKVLDNELGPFPARTIKLIRVKTKKFYIASGIPIMDIFLKKKVGNDYFWVVGKPNPVLKSVPAEFYEKRTRFNWKGYDFQVPADYEGYLTVRYGDWKKTVKDYNFRKDDKAIVDLK